MISRSRRRSACTAPADGALALRACLAARLQPPRAYLLEPHDVKELVPGIYDGAVYLTAPPRPLANLRVIVG